MYRIFFCGTDGMTFAYIIFNIYVLIKVACINKNMLMSSDEYVEWKNMKSKWNNTADFISLMINII